jgi:hypothetical protein
LDWVDYEALLAAWQGDFGGVPQAGYQRFVEAEFATTKIARGWG